jgi:hypothetical protein
LTRQALLGALLLAAPFLSGCIGDRVYRPTASVLHEKLRTRDFDPTQPPIATAEWPYTLTFLEFDDEGRMFVPDQLERTSREIASFRERHRGSAAPAPIIAVFVHGWKHNASEGSANVWGFRQTLAGLATQAPVLGVYVGWRGATVSLPILKQFTFFDRHRKSQSVPSGAMVEALRRIVHDAKGADGTGADVRLVLVGHSFGGAVLETAMTPQLRESIEAARQAATPEQRRVNWPADLIVLVNEAQEAERSYPLIEEMHRSLAPRPACTEVNEQNPYMRPAVLSISSRADYATRGFFPGAQLIGRPFNSPGYDGPDPLQAGKRRLYYMTTAHLRALQSHRIGRKGDPDIDAALATCGHFVLRSEISMFEEDEEFLLVEDPDAVNRTPYWVTWMPGDIVPDHSTIFTQVFRDYLVSLIAVATLLPPHDTLIDPAH